MDADSRYSPYRLLKISVFAFISATFGVYAILTFGLPTTNNGIISMFVSNQTFTPKKVHLNIQRLFADLRDDLRSINESTGFAHGDYGNVSNSPEVQLVSLSDESSSTIVLDKDIEVESDANSTRASTTTEIEKDLQNPLNQAISVFNGDIPDYVRAHIPEARCDTGRFLVYRCVSMCGGMGDREKGITSAFLLALLTNRTFVIDMPKPCELGQLLGPNLYNWQKCGQSIQDASKSSVLHFYMDGKGTQFLKSIPKTDFDATWKEDVLRMQINVIVADTIREHPNVKDALPWLRNLTREQILGYTLGTLFRVNDNVLNFIKEVKKSQTKDKTLVCSHIRYGKNPSIPNDGTLRWGPPNVTTILSFLEQYKNNDTHVLYIATDSDDVRVQAKNKFKNVLTGTQPIFHVDRSPRTSQNTSCDGFSHVIEEQVLLSRCDVLILTRSNFGSMAAYMRGHSNNLYLHNGKTNVMAKVSLSGVQEVYGFT